MFYLICIRMLIILSKRLLQAEGRNQELCESMSMSTRPLVRQIEALQDAAAKQAAAWEVRS